MNYIRFLERDMNLRILATIASTDETLAYAFHQSENPEKRKLADDMINRSNNIKRTIRDNTTGIEQKLFLELAEGLYIPKVEE